MANIELSELSGFAASTILGFNGSSLVWKPQPGGTSGSILFAGADGYMTENNSQFFWNNTLGALKLVDKNYVPLAGALNADNLFSVASNDNVQNNAGLITTSNHFVGAATDLKITASGAGKWYFGQLTQLRVGGSYTGSGQMVGHWVLVCNRGNLTATPYVYGTDISINLEGPASESVGAQISSYRGSAITCPTFVGIRSTAANGYSNATNVIGGEFIAKTVSSAATITNAIGVLSKLITTSGHTITNATGVSITDWSDAGSMSVIRGIHIDTSIDTGATSNHALYIESTSPSYHVGKLGIGSGTSSPTARLQVRDTAEQLRLEYNASNYLSTTLASDGTTLFSITSPGTPYFEFSHEVAVPDNTYDSFWNGSVAIPTRNGVDSAVNKDRYVEFFNDCVYASAVEQDIRINNSQAGMWITTLETTHGYSGYGFAKLNLRTNSNNTASVATSSFSTSALMAYRLGQGEATITARFAVETLSDGTNTYTMRVGHSDSQLAEPQNGAYFRYTHGTNSGKWEAVTRSSGSETATDTGVTATSASMKKFIVRVNSAGTSAEFYIDGTLVATNTTNIPTAANQPVGGGWFIQRSAGTTDNVIAATIDYVKVGYRFSSAR